MKKVNLDSPEVMKTITTVVDRIAPKYTFHGYTLDDIKQEAFIICMDGLTRYDGVRPLENFLSKHLSNRLKNFVRDNHYINTENEQRVKVIKPAQLDNENLIVDDGEDEGEIDRVDYQEIQRIITQYLPSQYRLDWLKMANDVYVSKSRKEEITAIVKDLLREHGYEGDLS